MPRLRIPTKVFDITTSLLVHLDFSTNANQQHLNPALHSIAKPSPQKVHGDVTITPNMKLLLIRHGETVDNVRGV